MKISKFLIIAALMWPTSLYAVSSPTYSFGWNETDAKLTVGNGTQVPMIKFPTSSISSETGEFIINAEGVEGLLMMSSSFGDIHINITGGPLFAMYGPGGYQGGDFVNINRPLRLDASNTDSQPSARLNVVSTTQGLLPPRMSTTQKNAIASPAEGLQVYDLTSHKMSFYNGSSWQNVCTN
jgi:hypothetical protein